MRKITVQLSNKKKEERNNLKIPRYLLDMNKILTATFSDRDIDTDMDGITEAICSPKFHIPHTVAYF
jgi:hypothetical protein